MNLFPPFVRVALLLLPLLVSCSDDLSGLRFPPTFGFPSATDVTRTGVTLNSSINNSEGRTVSACGFLYSTSPTMADYETLPLPSPVSYGRFSLKLENLEAGRRYYYCAYASNGYSTARSAIGDFTTVLEGAPVFSDLQVSMSGVSTAEVSATLVDDGGASLSLCGFIYREYADNSDNALTFGGDGVTFVYSPELKATLGGLQPGKSYVVCAVGLSGNLFGYSSETVIEIPSTPLPALSPVTFGDAVNSSVRVSATLLSSGSSDVVECGFCYSLERQEPTIDNLVAYASAGSNALSAQLQNLKVGETYYVCAFAKNAEGYAYGPVSTYTLLDGIVVSTGAATDVTAAAATLNGAVTFNNTGDIKSRGFCWSADNSRPTITDNNAVVSSSADGFAHTLSLLRPETTYYYCAFAENARGIVYGEVRTFTTLAAASGTAAAMFGTWNCREEHTDRLGQTYYNNYTLTFNADGTFTSSATTYVSSSWSVSGTELRANAITLATRDVDAGLDYKCTLDNVANPTRITGTVDSWLINSNTLGSTSGSYSVVLTRTSH